MAAGVDSAVRDALGVVAVDASSIIAAVEEHSLR